MAQTTFGKNIGAASAAREILGLCEECRDEQAMHEAPFTNRKRKLCCACFDSLVLETLLKIRNFGEWLRGERDKP